VDLLGHAVIYRELDPGAFVGHMYVPLPKWNIRTLAAFNLLTLMRLHSW
jgi:hypothetical protein